MTTFICTIAIAINVGGIGFITKADVQGKLLSQSNTKYLMDFSEGVKRYKLAGSPEDYKKILVDKTACVKE